MRLRSGKYSQVTEYPTFSEVLMGYIKKAGLNMSQLHRCIQIKCEWPSLSYDLLRKYCRGLRRPAPDFLILLDNCLNLTEAQSVVLKRSLLSDIDNWLGQEYQTAKSFLLEVDNPCLN